MLLKEFYVHYYALHIDMNLWEFLSLSTHMYFISFIAPHPEPPNARLSNSLIMRLHLLLAEYGPIRDDYHLSAKTRRQSPRSGPEAALSSPEDVQGRGQQLCEQTRPGARYLLGSDCMTFILMP